MLRKILSFAREATKSCWDMLPDSVLSSWAFLRFGKLIHKAHIRWQGRVEGLQITCFLRNVPLLEVLRDLALKVPTGGTWRVFSGFPWYVFVLQMG